MALRQIDNALPPTPSDHHRPSKPSGPNSAMPLNDENAPPAADAAIDYIASQDLQPLTDPDLTVLGLVEGLESKDWIQICDSLNDLRRLAIHHSPHLLPVLENVIVVTVKAMKNPRSALCKTSIMAASDIFTAFGDTMLLEETVTAETFDQLLLQLLLKASQDKKFVCEEADRALKSMVGSMTPLPLLRKLQKYVAHSNPRIRAKAAVSVSNCVSKMGLDGAKEFGLVSLVQTALKLLNDRLPEAREAARSMLVSIYDKFTENEEQKLESWQTFCETNLTAIQALAAIKVTPL
uniref:TOG domain-containing protein n=1 Tax=Kalanchoe fedtschenkoi TaxID=63787 RepID=A0A7N0UIJ1_KALFE